MLNYHPIPIISWEFIEPGTVVRDFIAEPKQFVRMLFEDGQVIIAGRHPTAHTKSGTARLYGAEGNDKRFFSLSSNGFNEIKPTLSKAMAENSYGGSPAYPKLGNFIDVNRKSGILCHHAMYEIWHGPRDPECHIHHLNRDKFDWCDDNLIQLKKKIEHPAADARQKLIESVVGDLHLLSHARLRELTLMPNNTFLHAVEDLRCDYSSNSLNSPTV